MNERPEQEIFEGVAEIKAIDAAFVEKDWFVTQVISSLFEFKYEGFEFVFTGGTALSKAHNLIQRFSEDVDFRVIAPKDQQNRSYLSRFKHEVIQHLRLNDFSLKNHHITALNDNRFIVIEFDYPSYFTTPVAIRPHVQIEISVKAPQRKGIVLPVSSFVNTLTKSPPEAESVLSIDPVESASDKLSALAWRIPTRIRGSENDDRALVRHIHDLALLKKLALFDEYFVDLVAASMLEDEGRLRKNPEFAAFSMAEKFQRMLSILNSDKEYPGEYDVFVKGVSYAVEGETPDFTMGLNAVQALVDRFLKA
ncbi:MAG: nucleotidyl transferase AbiEii/AbiGii toxin family protein [Chlorobiaceae bacterium]|nr:nucleotidyl transferase AbiEii/AbiGii toxin family protein [Chlorobiaceae bacterium]